MFFLKANNIFRSVDKSFPTRRNKEVCSPLCINYAQKNTGVLARDGPVDDERDDRGGILRAVDAKHVHTLANHVCVLRLFAVRVPMDCNRYAPSQIDARRFEPVGRGYGRGAKGKDLVPTALSPRDRHHHVHRVERGHRFRPLSVWSKPALRRGTLGGAGRSPEPVHTDSHDGGARPVLLYHDLL